MEKFFNFVNTITSLSEDSVKELKEILVLKKHFAKEHICQINSIPTKVFFLISGVVRFYTLLPNGNQYTRNIYTDGNIMGSFTALVENKESKYALQCLTDCEIIECDYKDFKALADKNLDVAIFNRKYLEMLYVGYINRNIEFLTLNATERFLSLKNRIPTIESILSQKQIATHLAITPIQLSRIKSKILYQ